MKIYIISDTHFNHENIIKYCNRPFKDINEMNDTIINNWNMIVKKDDIVYHLGDFFLGSKFDLKNIVDRLNGTIYLIRGNHEERPENIRTYKEINIFGGKVFVEDDYPYLIFAKNVFKTYSFRYILHNI